ncbi:MAG: hypothetical protein EOP85_13920 [Verrucomicrobiaceae bacterium]|nr:MAG: hypothetical protein EOP85_13920 [Verrucomicrobiaceae bacterium]
MAAGMAGGAAESEEVTAGMTEGAAGIAAGTTGMEDDAAGVPAGALTGTGTSNEVTLAGGSSSAGEVITPAQCGQGPVVGGKSLGMRIFPSQCLQRNSL